MYRRALEVGILPSEFGEMSLKEAHDTVSSRIRQKNDEIYALSAMIRTAVVSAFSKDVPFPQPPNREEKQDWQNSKNYLRALQKLKGGAG